MEYLIALLFLTAMEIVLGIDNIVFIAILTSRLPHHLQASARRIGLTLAMGMRILLLFTLKWILGLEDPIFHLSDLGLSGEWLGEEVNDISVRDLSGEPEPYVELAQPLWKVVEARKPAASSG